MSRALLFRCCYLLVVGALLADCRAAQPAAFWTVTSYHAVPAAGGRVAPENVVTDSCVAARLVAPGLASRPVHPRAPSVRYTARGRRMTVSPAPAIALGEPRVTVRTIQQVRKEPPQSLYVGIALLIVGGALAVLGLLAWLLTAITAASFGEALLSALVGVPSFLLLGTGLQLVWPRRRVRRSADGTTTKLPKDAQRDGAARAGVLWILLGLAGLGLAVTLVTTLAFGPAVLYIAAAYLGLMIVSLVLNLVGRGVQKLTEN